MKEYNWDLKPDAGQGLFPEKDTQKPDLEGSETVSETHGLGPEGQRVKTPELRRSGLQSSRQAEWFPALFREAVDEPR